MKMDNTFVTSLLTGAMASFGIERKANGNGKKKDDKSVTVDNKNTKAESNEKGTSGTSRQFAQCSSTR